MQNDCVAYQRKLGVSIWLGFNSPTSQITRDDDPSLPDRHGLPDPCKANAQWITGLVHKHLLMISLGLCLIFSSAEAQESSTLRKIKETGIISIGFRDGSLPFSYLDKKQKPIGYSIDICYKVVDSIREKLRLDSLEVKFLPVSSANRIPFVINGIVDIECGTTTNTDERQKKVSFSVTTFIALSSFASKKNSNIHSITDLKGKAVASTAGTTYSQALTDLNRTRGYKMNILLGKDHAESFLLVEADRAIAHANDDVLLHGLIANSKKPEDYVIYNSGLSIEPYGMTMRRNDPDFKRVVDEAIIDLFKNGEINRIYDKWFQSTIPPNEINLRLPMSSMLKKAIAHPTDSSNQDEYR